MKYYAVKKGLNAGIYDNWEDCKEQVTGYAGAVFKSFKTYEEAKAFLDLKEAAEHVNINLPYAYIDGSYQKATCSYGYGGYIHDNGRYYIIQGSGNNEEYGAYRNVTGEVRGVLEVIKTAVEQGIKELNIYYDYLGIECWANGYWKCKNKLSSFYKAYYDKHCKDLKIHFIHVKGHTGIEGNELADILAKNALGIHLTKKQTAELEAFKKLAV